MPLQCAYCDNPATFGRTTRKGKPQCIPCAAVETIEIPPTEEKRAPVPSSISESPVWKIASPMALFDTLWLHQSIALDKLDQGLNTAVATPTASGKSLIFQLHTLKTITSAAGSTAAVFYPTKALANDQTSRWQQAAATIGLPDTSIAQIDGDVPMPRRNPILSQARVLILTPDVCHAWLLRRSTDHPIHNFLANLKIIIIDEAHTYESVFGSNSAYLFRRLVTASLSAGNPSPPQFIAATATILHPKTHLENLTGQPFAVVEQDNNGSPRHHRTLHHLPLMSQGVREYQMANMILAIIDNDPEAQVIAFHDSRQGVERIVQAADRPTQVLPYRSGYLAQDRRDIENSLRNNTIRAVVATNALELGIDMPDLNYGLTMDLPPSRKQFHQRLGRVGRSRPATFAILAPANRFSDFGDALKDYYDNSVEPSHLYLDNQHITFRQAQCLKLELESNNRDTHAPPAGATWPPTFDQALKYAHGRPPAQLANAQPTTAKPPHQAHSLRSSGEGSLEIYNEGTNHQEKGTRALLGSINLSPAIVEAYPGAVYRHRGQSYTVNSWHQPDDFTRPSIQVSHAGRSRDRTTPIPRTLATLPKAGENQLATREIPNGSITQLQASITKSVEGYILNKTKQYHYHQLKDRDPRKTRKQYTFPTTLVHIKIDEPWFTGPSGPPWQARVQLAETLRRYLAYHGSIVAQDIGTLVDNVFIETEQGFHTSDNSIVVYDNIFGGMGLVDALFKDIDHYAKKILESLNPNNSHPTTIHPPYAASFAQWLRGGNCNRYEPSQPPGKSSTWRVIRLGTKVPIYSPAANDLVDGAIANYFWDDGIKYHVRAGQGTITATDRQLVEQDRDQDWQLWIPEKGITQDIPTDTG